MKQRPKKLPADLGSLARAYTLPGIKILGGYINSPDIDPEIKIRAIGMMWDRGWGRPAQPVTGKDGTEDIRVTIRTIIEGYKK
jgi:hypothetical protein